MANEVVDKALEGFSINEIDWDNHKMRPYLVDANLAGPGGGGWTVSGVTNTTNPTITTAANHGLAAGDRVAISGVGGVTGVNGNWTVASTPAGNTFTISAGAPGAYSSGGFIANLSKKYVSEYAGSGARVVGSRITNKSGVNGYLRCGTMTWTGVAGGAFEFVLIAMTATVDSDGQTDLADNAQRIVAHLDTLNGLPIQQNPGNVSYTPDGTVGVGRV